MPFNDLGLLATWNPATNSPRLISGKGQDGMIYCCSVAGSYALDGNSQWNAGDFAAFSGATGQWYRLGPVNIPSDEEVILGTDNQKVITPAKLLLALGKFNIVSVASFGAKGDGIHDDWPAITAAMEYVNLLGGGWVIFPHGTYAISAPLDNKYFRVTCMGAGYDFYHDGGDNVTFGTKILPTFAGTALRHRTPYVSTSAKFSGGGWLGFTVVGNQKATILLDIDTINGGQYDLYVEDCVGQYAIWLRCGVTGVDLAEACDIQYAWLRARGRQFYPGAAQSCGGMCLTGSSTSNPSFNKIDFQVQHVNGHAMEIISADNNEITLTGIKAGGGTGKLLLCRGVTAAHPVGGDSNVFVHLSGTGAIYAEGTADPGVTQGVRNIIRAWDDGNATPVPTAGAGSYWLRQSLLYGTQWGFTSGPMVIGDFQANIFNEVFNLGTSSLRIVNTSSDHIELTDGTNVWGLGIDGATGDLRVVRLAGGGNINFGNGVGVKLWTPGFNGTAPTAKPTVAGAKGGNVALANLLTALATMGLLTDSTT